MRSSSTALSLSSTPRQPRSGHRSRLLRAREAQPYCIAVAKGDPKGLLPGINEAIAKMTSENKMEEFIAAADELSGKAVEVTADAPAA